MRLESERLAIADLVLIRPQRFFDTRGYFAETYNQRSFSELGITTNFVQDNEVFSKTPGTLRGLHLQLAPFSQAKLIRVVNGSIFDVAVDLRSGSSTFGRWCSTILTGSGGEQIFIPVGFAHGYCTLEPNTLVSYKVDVFYDKLAEAGINWEDPEIGIIWPLHRDAIIVSEEDRGLPLLRNVGTRLRFNG